MTLATSRQMLVRLGFAAISANDIYQRQGIDSSYEWEDFDKDDVVSFLRLVGKTGGDGNGDIVGLKRSSIYSLPCSSYITRSAPAGQWIMGISLFLRFAL